MSKKNIAIIIQKLNGGGAERAATNLSLILDKYFNVHLIVFDGRNIKYPYAGEIHDLNLSVKEGMLNKIITALKRTQKVRRIKMEHQIDASISLMDGANLVNVLSRVNDKVITSVRIKMSSANSRLKNGKLKRFELHKMRFIAKFSDKVVAVAQGVKDDLIDNFGIEEKKISTIYNLCDGEMLKKKALVHLPEASIISEYSITTMGRLSEQKGQWHLIRAFSEVVKVIPNAKLYILGEGPLKDKLIKLVEDLGLKDSIVFLGYVEAPHAYIMNSKVFVLPSLYEGLSNVLLEAMACGTPCIATDCHSGSREIIEPGTKVKEKLSEIEFAKYGILTSVGNEQIFVADETLTSDEKQIAKAIISILTDDSLQKHYGNKAFERSKDFCPDVIGEQWVKLIN